MYICPVCGESHTTTACRPANAAAGPAPLLKIPLTASPGSCEICDLDLGPSSVCLKCWNPTAKENGELYEQVKDLKRERQQLLLQIETLTKERDEAAGWKNLLTLELSTSERLRKEQDRLKDEQAQLLSKCLDVFARFAGGPIIAHPPKCRFYIEGREKDCTCKAKDLMNDVLLTLKDLRANLESQEPLKRNCEHRRWVKTAVDQSTCLDCKSVFPFVDPTERKAEKVVQDLYPVLKALPEEERKIAFDGLWGLFCRTCYRLLDEGRKCHCWNDE